MFPVLKRKLLGPWYEYRKKLQLIKSIRSPMEIANKMKHFNYLSLEAEVKGKKSESMEFRIMCETLQWVLRTGENGNSK